MRACYAALLILGSLVVATPAAADEPTAEQGDQTIRLLNEIPRGTSVVMFRNLLTMPSKVRLDCEPPRKPEAYQN